VKNAEPFRHSQVLIDMSSSPNKKGSKVHRFIAFFVLTSLCILAFVNIDNFLEIYRAIFLDALRYRNPARLSDYDETYHYTFEPETILSAAGQGEKKLFQPIPDYLEDDVYPPGFFSWQQQDYLKVSNALYQFANKDTLTYWKLYLWSFDKNCGDNPVGFNSAHIAYFNSSTGEHTEIAISPLSKEADWGKNDQFESPSFWGWKSIDLSQIKITADDALQIAETHGGEDARLAEQNQCYISVYLFANTNLWEVHYYGNSSENIFEMTIDPYYGNYKIIVQKK
jgi:hypothetical protein